MIERLQRIGRAQSIPLYHLNESGAPEGMDTYPGKEQWYAAFVEAGQEDDAKERLQYRFDGRLKFLVPKREMRERKKSRWHYAYRTLFPGYILINGSIEADEYYEIKKVPGIWDVLNIDGDILTIPQEEIQMISRLTSDGEIIGPSNIYEKGGDVKVVDGPLYGMEGRIIRVDKRKGRAKVNISFLGEEKAIDLAVNVLCNI